MKSIVVAYDKKFGIGADNQLLWQRDLPADMQHFKEMTTGHVIIMGHKTFESIGRALSNRQNIVISRNRGLLIPGVDVVDSLEEAYAIALPNIEIFVIGGAQIYTLALPTVEVIHATEVDATFGDATVFFPAIDIQLWRETAREHHERDDRNFYNYDFVTYSRR